MNTTIQRISLPEGRRILMISDLHGHADGLKEVLQKARFSQGDVLVIVGDLIEKGPQSLETLRLVLSLAESHTVYPLMGNVDLWRLEPLRSDQESDWEAFIESSLRAKGWWGSSLLHEMCAEIGVPLTRETPARRLQAEIRRHFRQEIDFLSSLPVILDTQRFTFVHGGIPHERLDELEGKDAYPLLKYDNFYAEGLSFEKYVTVGHWPAVLYSRNVPDFAPIIDRKRRIICLDGACGVKKEGQLNLLILPDVRSDDFSLVTWDDLPVIRALDRQSGSDPEKARYISWSDHAVTLLRKGEQTARILYHGQPMTVPADILFDHHGVLSCADVTDYRLPVSPGDEMRLALKYATGCYVKKNGVAGWYTGRYAT